MLNKRIQTRCGKCHDTITAVVQGYDWCGFAYGYCLNSEGRDYAGGGYTTEPGHEPVCEPCLRVEFARQPLRSEQMMKCDYCERELSDARIETVQIARDEVEFRCKDRKDCREAIRKAG